MVKIRDGLASLFKSTTELSSLALQLFLSVVIITWFHIFAHALVVISAAH